MLYVGPHVLKVVRYDYESVTSGSTCPICVGVKMARGVGCGSTCPKCGKILLRECCMWVDMTQMCQVKIDRDVAC